MTESYGSTLTILVVEDDHAVAELMRSVLNRVPGWGATVVHDAAAAREYPSISEMSRKLVCRLS